MRWRTEEWIAFLASQPSTRQSWANGFDRMFGWSFDGIRGRLNDRYVGSPNDRRMNRKKINRLSRQWTKRRARGSVDQTSQWQFSRRCLCLVDRSMSIISKWAISLFVIDRKRTNLIIFADYFCSTSFNGTEENCRSRWFDEKKKTTQWKKFRLSSSHALVVFSFH